MRIRPKLSGAPLAYTLHHVGGAADHYGDFGRAVWSEERELSAITKELVFLRTSLVNHCGT